MSKKLYAKVGGQAVMEGIMMRSPKKDVLAVRTPGGEIVVEPMVYKSIKGKFKWFKWPFIRGVIGFIDSLTVGYKSLMRSAEFFAEDDSTASESVGEQTNNKPEKEKKNTGLDIALFFSALLGVAIAIGLFVFLPNIVTEFIKRYWSYPYWVDSVIGGVLRILIMLIYIIIVAQMKDIKRLFQYHGAEHKTIFCFENREELTVDNVKKYTRLHPRCGTSFLLIVFIIGMLFSMCMKFIPFIHTLLSEGGLSGRLIYTCISILFIPVVAGISYEIQQYSGKHCNLFTKIVSAPGLAFQKITTKEPDDDQIEVAIAALTASLTDENGNLDAEAAYK